MSNSYSRPERAAVLIQHRVATYPAHAAGRIKRWLKTFTACALSYVLLLRLGSDSFMAALNPNDVVLWFALLLAAIVGVVGVLEADVSFHRMKHDPDAAAVRLAARFSMLTGQGWMMRTALLGVVLGLTLGIPVALLNAARSGLPLESQLPSLVRFIALTVSWSVPFAFVVRYGYLRTWLRHADERAA